MSIDGRRIKRPQPKDAESVEGTTMAYPGGKAGAGVYQRIINQIPPHDVYIEPFLGAGAVMRRKRPASASIGVDADCRVLDDRWNAVTLPGLQLHCCDGIEWLKHRFDLYRIDPSSDSESGVPGRDVGSRDGGSDDSVAGSVARSGGDGQQSSYFNDAEFRVGIPASFVYCDPPYPIQTRRSNRPIYDHEMTIEQHEDLLRVLTRLPAAVMVSSYWSDLYASALKGWRSIKFEATTRGGSSATEWLWMNYQEPAVLHDYRYLGDDKRQRERIRRKVTNWTEGLDRLPNLERNAILQSITSR